MIRHFFRKAFASASFLVWKDDIELILMRWQIDSLTADLWQTKVILGNPASVFRSLRRFAKSCSFLQCTFSSHLTAISIRLFLDLSLKLSTDFCLLVSSLHEAGSLLLFFLAPSRFLLPFLKGFACHKNSFSVMGAPVAALCPAHCLFFFRLLHSSFAS
jgi:hypothetical protein